MNVLTVAISERFLARSSGRNSKGHPAKYFTEILPFCLGNYNQSQDIVPSDCMLTLAEPSGRPL
eukprot:2843403-Amphidinium_carterae.1